MKTAVIILNWNGKKLLEQFLPSVVNYSAGADLYVADNNSTDDSVSFLKSKYPEIQIIQNRENGGYAKGYNDALKEVKADIFCLLNSDVEVTPGWLEPVEDIFKKHPEVGIVQPKILDQKRKGYFEYAGAAGGYIDMLGYPLCRGRIFQSLEEDTGQYNDVKEIFWASGACFFVRSSVFRELGGFDEDFFAHQEEIDFCWRTRNRGLTAFYTGHSHVYHVGGATLNNMNPKKTFLNFRNSLFSITKNVPRRYFLSVLVTRWFLDIIAAIRFVLQLRFQHFWAIVKAHISYGCQFRKMLAKRENISEKNKYYIEKSIVWSYFVRNKKRFTDLIKY
ncbi:glycosyltransferase family 2 protein [Ascidiimonas aurantiaca]|uniref:glycosyltransferase family 2 protein n=1 Tax=Ascidiimonas aurantiaca TaxID=1685432 RepID=UPI0030ED150A